MEIALGAAAPTVGEILAVARGRAQVTIADAAVARINEANALLRRLADEGAPIYGVTTGLGAAVDTVVAASDALQRRIPLARAVGVGRRAGTEEVRAMMTARLARLCTGRSGVSLAIAETLAAMLNAGVHPEVPMTGSLGEADLAPLAHLALALLGKGTVERDGVDCPAAVALAGAGIAIPPLGPKDGIALLSSNAASVGGAAVVVADAESALAAQIASAALSLEGFRGNVSPFDPAAAGARPAAGQARAARAIMALLAGGDLAEPGAARRLQDPLSFRCFASVSGAALAALAVAREAVEVELASSDDNPAVLVEEGRVLANANFDPTHMVVALEALGLVLARVAATAAERVMKLMSHEFSGLPRFLASPQPGHNGFAAVQKTVSALMAEISHLCQPVPIVIIPVADRVEDYGTMATLAVQKTADIVARLRLVATIELIVAAQAIDLRGLLRLGVGTHACHTFVRAHVRPLEEDRPTAPDITRLAAAIAGGGMDAVLASYLEVR